MSSTSLRVLVALALLNAPKSGNERSIALRVGSVRYLATDEHAASIAPELIAPTGVAEFLAATEDERVAILVERFTEHRRAERRSRASMTPREVGRLASIAAARRVAAATAPSTAASDARTIASSTQQFARWSVSCADGCGAMIPAPGPRPVIRYRDPSHRPAPRRGRRSTSTPAAA